MSTVPQNKVNGSAPPPVQVPILEARQGKGPQIAVQPQQVVPLKVGIYGPQGSGKTVTAALLAAALSVQFYRKAPIYVVDPDLAWQFPKRRIFGVEGVEVHQKPFRSFAQMKDSLTEAEKLGCCCWIVDPLTLIWNELLDTFRGTRSFIPIDSWGQIRQLWNAYIQLFLNSPMNCFALGRLGNEFEEQQEQQQNGEIKTKLVKVGTKFKAGGGESFGYEPHLLLEMSLERKPKTVRGQEREAEGRMVHRADILKDRTWVLNGSVLRFTGKSSYERGGYAQVWKSIKPHFEEVQATMARVQILPGSSESLLGQSGDSEYYQRKQRKDVLVAELHAAMELLWGGTGKAEKQIRLRVFEHIFGFRSKEAADAASLQTIERGVRILQIFERRIKEGKTVMPTTEEGVLAEVDNAINAYTQDQMQDLELPF